MPAASSIAPAVRAGLEAPGQVPDEQALLRWRAGAAHVLGPQRPQPRDWQARQGGQV